MADVIIKGGTVVDGTGAPPARADVAVSDGRIAAIGTNLGNADRVIDAGGLVVAPGFIDIHTHYDAQVLWDPWLTPSSTLGVTSVIAGNCGFTLAPCKPEHRDTMVGTLESVEDMSPDTLRAGIEWSFETFGEYLQAISRRGLGINYGAYVGHTALRIFAMGDAAYERQATDDEVATMVEALGVAMKSGARGFSTDRSRFHRGDQGRPVPSAVASRGEIEALLSATAAHRGIAEINPDDEFDWLYEVGPRTGCAITWTALVTYPAKVAGRTWWRDKLDAHRAGWERGARVRPQVTCRPLTVQFSLTNPTPFISAPVFKDLMARPEAERAALYRDDSWRSAAREQLRDKAHANVRWEKISDADTGKPVGDFDTMADLALASNMRARFNTTVGNDDEDGVRELLNEPGCLLGISDAGAHVAMLCDASMPVDFLAHWVRDRQVMPLESAIRRLTLEPAQFYGLGDRGELRVGAHADIVAFDLDALSPGPLARVRDLPANGDRLLPTQVRGIEAVLVNGRVAAERGTWSQASLAGVVL